MHNSNVIVRTISVLAQSPVSGVSALEIAASIETAIRERHFQPGDGLPTIRALAADLGTSPATVASAYRRLQARGLARSNGRAGTFVAPAPAVARTVVPPTRPGARNLSLGYPDPSLLPSLKDAVGGLEPNIKLPPNRTQANDRQLLEQAAASFEADGIPPDNLAVVGGGLDGIERALQTELRSGDRVLVEDPCYPPVRDLIAGLGLIAVPAFVDDVGIDPEQFELRLREGVQAVIITPRAQNPMGAALEAGRAVQLYELLGEHPQVLVIEDDHAGPVAGAPAVNLASLGLPRWTIIRSYSKTLHPDLRLAVMAGDATTIARLERRQMLGTGWVSHILQRLTSTMLLDPETLRCMERARETYRARRMALLDSLAQRGVLAHGRSGLNVWLPVQEETATVQTLLELGWVVGSGERYRISSPPGIRITIATLALEEAEPLAEAISEVAHHRAEQKLY